MAGGRTFYAGKRALVVGASEGIGLAIAEELAARGAHVVITSRDPAKLAVAAERVTARRKSSDQSIGWAAFDVRDADAVDREISRLSAEKGVPDFAILCAGFSHPGYFEDLDLAQHRAMMELNHFGTLHVVRALVPAMVARGRGHIVTTSSGLGFLGLFGFTGYCASKFAVVGFSEALRSELQTRGVRVSCFCPPAVETPGFARENVLKPVAVAAAEARANILQAPDVARYLLDRLPGDPFLVIPGWEMRFYHRAHRLMPGVVRFFTRRPKP